MTMALYLDHYMGSAHHMPTELKRNFSLMHDLDVRVQSLMKKIDQRSDSYLTNIETLSEHEKKKQRKKIHYLFNKARQYGDNKIQIAIDSYELVDKFINRLDGDMEKYKAIMAGQNKKGSKKDKKKSKKRVLHSSDDDSDNGIRKKRCPAGASAGDTSGVSAGGAAEAAGPSGGAAQPSVEAPAKADGQNEGEGNSSSQSTDYLDMPVDPNEPTYCICNQVSYGEMIACDNTDCPIEWFHFPCVGLTTKPLGEWYCPKCTAERKKPVRNWSRPKFVIKPK